MSCAMYVCMIKWIRFKVLIVPHFLQTHTLSIVPKSVSKSMIRSSAKRPRHNRRFRTMQWGWVMFVIMNELWSCECLLEFLINLDLYRFGRMTTETNYIIRLEAGSDPHSHFGIYLPILCPKPVCVMTLCTGPKGPTNPTSALGLKDLVGVAKL